MRVSGWWRWWLVAVGCAVGVASAQHPLVVLDATDKTFDEVIAKGKWLVKFYAPWCGHCKRLAPVLAEVAKNHFKGRIGIAKIDVDAYPSFKKRFDIRGFPTIEYFEDGEQATPYNGGRDVASFASFGERVAQEPIRTFDEKGKLDAWLNRVTLERDPKKDPVSFVLLASEASEIAPTSATFQAVESVAKSLRPYILFAKSPHWDAVCAGHEKEAACNDRSEPRLIRYEVSEEPRAFQGDLKDTESLMTWVRANTAPVFSEADSHNFGVLSNQPGKNLVLIAYNPNDNSARQHIDRLRIVARGKSALPDSIRSTLVFASIDGVRWSDFLSEYNVHTVDLPRVVVLDFATSTFYEDKALDSRQDILALLEGAANGSVPAQSSGGITATIRRLWRLFINGLPGSGIIAGLLLAVFGAFSYFICCSSSDDDDDSVEEPSEQDKAEDENAAESKKAK